MRCCKSDCKIDVHRIGSVRACVIIEGLVFRGLG